MNTPNTVTKLDPVFASVWLESLRGENTALRLTFRQGTGLLRSGRTPENGGLGYEHCCLGVASEVLCADPRLAELYDRIEAETGYSWNAEEGQWESLGGKPLSTSVWEAELPPKVREILGLRRDDQDRLIQLNDNEYDTFPEIADYIETEILAQPPAPE